MGVDQTALLFFGFKIEDIEDPEDLEGLRDATTGVEIHVKMDMGDEGYSYVASRSYSSPSYGECEIDIPTTSMEKDIENIKIFCAEHHIEFHNPKWYLVVC